MKMRRMFTSKARLLERTDTATLFSTPQDAPTYLYTKYTHPVIVLDGGGAPDFGPGGWVWSRRSPHVGKHRVRFIGQDADGRWWISLPDYGTTDASLWEKVPAEKSVLLRFTGPEKEVERKVAGIIHNLTPWSTVPNPEGVRVERVEADDE